MQEEITKLQQENRLLKERVELIENFVADFVYSDRIIFQRNIQIQDGRYFQFALGEGSKIGTATTQKIALWGKTPIVQPSSASQAALALDSNVSGADTVSLADVNSNFAAIQVLVNQLRTDLIAIGLIKGSA